MSATGKMQRTGVWFVLLLVSILWLGILVLDHFEMDGFDIGVLPFNLTKKRHPSFLSGAENYFKNASRLNLLPPLINTPGCRIPNISEWDEELSPNIKKPTRNANAMFPCAAKNSLKSFYSIERNILSLRNEEMLGRCCVRTIDREEASLSQYSMDADSRLTVSSCTELTQMTTTLYSEFVVVECQKPFEFKTIRNIHASVYGKNLMQFPPTRPSTQLKLDYWANRRNKPEGDEGSPVPPNILIFGQDTTSRLNFRRFMGRTRRVLESLGAVEMPGYVKVGDNTLPNLAALLCGYSVEDLHRLCIPTHTTSLDKCPFIWSRFDEARYLTAHAEDSPQVAIFNYQRPGFVHQPTDFYLRPAFLGAKKLNENNKGCIGDSSNDEFLLSYVQSAVEFSRENGVPLFATSWSTFRYHEDPNKIQEADDTYAEFILRLKQKELLNNTILVLMGDHGYRYGKARNTLPGYFENKLPNLWILMSEDLTETYPHWKAALEFNSKGLSSPYTMYWTLNLLLDTFAEVSPLQDASVAVEGKDKNSPQVISRWTPKKRHSFLHKIPQDASCNDLGIVDEFCPCWSLQEASEDDIPVLQELMDKTASWINSDIINGTYCQPLRGSSIYAGAVAERGEGESETTVKRYVASFITSPGSFRVEAEMNYSPVNQSFTGAISVNRVNSISGSDTSCVSKPIVENFCSC